VGRERMFIALLTFYRNRLIQHFRRLWRGVPIEKRFLTCEHDVFFCPTMDLMAMRTRQPRAIQFRAVPGGFFNRLAGCGKAASRRTADEDPFDDGTSGRFYGAG
jgi:hypothetical protein